MKLHFIAIGGAAMHNLAIALHKKGEIVNGSDDEIFEPSRGRLAKYGLLPENIGWDETKVDESIDAIILGMHARSDNPELLKAQTLGLKIYSYPEFLYEHAKDKTRVVIGGSHGKTTITAMLLHVMKQAGIETDYMVGAQLEGFEVMVKLSDNAKFMVFEGDEYLTSPLDLRPKFHLYKPHIALLSGIAWDHINVFPTLENYIDQFRIFINLIEKEGSLTYCANDETLNSLLKEKNLPIRTNSYSLPDHFIKDGKTFLKTAMGEVALEIFGEHNLLNLNGAHFISKELGITDRTFYEAIGSFKGASNRLQRLAEDRFTILFKDFAHSPSKLKATIEAVKKQFPDRGLVACMELHTFSSLNQDFLKEYSGSMDMADYAFVYYNPETIKHKKLSPLTNDMVREAFKHRNLKIYNNSEVLISYLLNHNWRGKNILMMSSGNFDGLDYPSFARNVLQK